MREQPSNRREFLRDAAGAALSATALTAAALTATDISRPSQAADSDGFRLRYILGSCMYGTTALAEILPEVRRTGADALDIWPRVHGNQREQVDELGHEHFTGMLASHKVGLGMVTRYDLGPFGLEPEMRVAQKFGARILITGSRGPKGLAGTELKSAVGEFAEQMKPHIALAEEHNLVIGIENHGNALIESPDSIRWFADATRSPSIGIALAPYHLDQDTKLLAGLVRDLGPRLVHFYAWQHGMGCHVKLPKEQELLQMPGRGELDFTPIIAALKGIEYQGWTEIFMHPVPRGIPILPTTAEVTAEINHSRDYLTACLGQIQAADRTEAGQRP